MKTDRRGPYRVYYMNEWVATFDDRDEALKYVHDNTNVNDYEILDRSDD